MPEYYGYAEREASAYVDWASLGKNLTETVQKSYEIREERKRKLDEVMQKNYSELADAPSGLNQDINRAITSQVSNSKQFIGNAYKLMKAGILKPEDYTLVMQNQKEDTKAIFDNAKNWQAAWAKTQESVINGDGSQAMLDVQSDVASFGKFKDMDFMINPVTGRISASKMITNANGERVKGQSLSMQQLNVLMNQEIKKYNMTEKLVSAQKAIGDFINSDIVQSGIQRQGSITKITDARVQDSFNKAKNTFIKEVMANPFNTMSILRDYVGEDPNTGTAYRVSTNPADKGKDGIVFLADPDGDGSSEPQLTDEQKKVVEQYATDQFIGLFDRKVEKEATAAIAPSYPPEYIALRGDKAREKEMAVGAWSTLYWGDAQQKRDAAQTLLGTTIAQEQGLVDIDLETVPDSVVLKFEQRNDAGEVIARSQRVMPFSKDGKTWAAEGNQIHGENDVNKALKAAGNTFALPLNKDYKGARASRVFEAAKTEASKIAEDAYVTDINKNNTKQTIINLKAKLPKGFTVEDSSGAFPWNDEIKIIYTLPDGSTVSSESFPINDGDAPLTSALIAAYVNDKLSTAAPASGGAGNSGGKAR